MSVAISHSALEYERDASKRKASNQVMESDLCTKQYIRIEIYRHVELLQSFHTVYIIHDNTLDPR